MRDVFYVAAFAHGFVCLLWVCDKVAGWLVDDE